MSRDFRIVIVGAGIAGLTMAVLLARSRHRDRLRVMLVDAAERPRHDPGGDIALRVSSIATGSAMALDALGAWSIVAGTRACAYESMRVWDRSESVDGPSTLRFDAADFAVPQLGFIVENDLLRHALLTVLADTDAATRFGVPITAAAREGDAATLSFADGSRADANLVIGADGARSKIRDFIGIESREWPYRQTAFVTHLRPEQHHRHTAWQRFLKEGPLGILPLSDGRVSVVWSTTAETAERALAASDDQLGDMLTAASDHVLGELAPAGPRGTFPLKALHARRYVTRRVALIGDAAHAIHPLAGQGANLGLQDAATLAEFIDAALDAGEHPGDLRTLRRYERTRKGANATMLHFLAGLNRLFAADSSLLRELRTIGMRLFNHSGPIRERAVRVALGMDRR